jgi:hypothetical protein
MLELFFNGAGAANEHGCPFQPIVPPHNIARSQAMIEYVLTGLEKTTMSADRSQFNIEFKTGAGPVVLRASAAHLGALITSLQEIEYQASLLDPAKGLLPGEPRLTRAKLVDDVALQRGQMMGGVPGMLLGIKVGQEARWYALDSAKAKILHRALGREIPKIAPARRAQ